MIRLEIKNYNIILKERQQKHQFYHRKKLNVLEVKKHHPL